jgi:hypothetical protein
MPWGEQLFALTYLSSMMFSIKSGLKAMEPDGHGQISISEIAKITSSSNVSLRYLSQQWNLTNTSVIFPILSFMFHEIESQKNYLNPSPFEGLKFQVGVNPILFKHTFLWRFNLRVAFLGSLLWPTLTPNYLLSPKHNSHVL